MFAALPCKMKHSTHAVAVTTLSIFEEDVRKWPQKVGSLCTRCKNKYLEIKVGNRGGVVETHPHKMVLDRLCSGQRLVLHHIATASRN